MKRKTSIGSAVASFLEKNKLLRNALFILGVLAASHQLYFKQYYLPAGIYWDEVYYIPSAAKYIQGVHQMEAHPPLGKILIAFGENFLNWGEEKYGWSANHKETFGLEKVHSSSAEFPEGFTFAGYRLLPALAGWINALLFCLVLFQLSSSRLWALFFLPLYLFDNALIAQSRGALLDPFILSGILLALWGFLKAYNLKLTAQNSAWPLFIMVLGFSLAVLTKLLGLIVLLLWPLLFWLKRKDKKQSSLLRKYSMAQALLFLLFFVGVWSYHFEHGKKIEATLPVNGFYMASEEFQEILNGKSTRNSLESFWIGLRDNYRFFSVFHSGIQAANPDSENQLASRPVLWPLGIKPLYYRNTFPDEAEQRHHYMVANPASWLFALLGILAALGVLGAQIYRGKKLLSQRYLELLGVLLILYFSYMLSVISISRMLYLNHYFIALIFSYCILATLLVALYEEKKNVILRKAMSYFFWVFPALVMGAFFIYKPFTYYEPLTCAEAAQRNIIPFWKMPFNFCDTK